MFEFGDGLADGRFFDDLAVVSGSDQQSSDAKAIDQARHTFGVFVDAHQGIIGEERGSLILGELDVMANVGDGLSQIEGGQVVMGGQALVEGFVGSQAEGTAQFRLTDEEQDAQGLAVHFGGEE